MCSARWDTNTDPQFSQSIPSSRKRKTKGQLNTKVFWPSKLSVTWVKKHTHVALWVQFTDNNIMLYAVHVGWKGGHSFYPLMKFEQQEVLTSFERQFRLNHYCTWKSHYNCNKIIIICKLCSTGFGSLLKRRANTCTFIMSY